jgi:P27 family predicted phage terminase small subunit
MPAERKSAARKRLQGTARADRQPHADYASRLRELPPAPRSLPPDARRIWRNLAAITVGLGVLTAADLPLLELLVVTIGAEAHARATLKADGLTIGAGSGGRKKHPAAAIAETARSQALTMMREFGLSPKARQSVDTAPPPQINPFTRFGKRPPADDFESFLASKPPVQLAAYLATDPDLADGAPRTTTPGRRRRVA